MNYAPAKDSTHRSSSPSNLRLKVGMILGEGFDLMSLSCFVDFLRIASDSFSCEWDTLSSDLHPVASSCGLKMKPSKTYDAKDDYSHIIINGQDSASLTEGLVSFIEKARSKGIPIIGVHSGQMIMARTGMLDGKNCAVHSSLLSFFREHYPKIKLISDQPIVRDGNIVTCPGGLASISLAMELITEQSGREHSIRTLKYLLADKSLDEIQRLKDSDIELNCPDQRLVTAVSMMRQRVHGNGSVTSIADAIGMSEREITRLFNLHLKTPPATYWRRIRLESAHWLVINTKRTINDIAHEFGFADSSHFISWFKRVYKITPSRLRTNTTSLAAQKNQALH
ncbi:GlxA family transcriptional regulator [Pseudomonas sp. NPDC089547]|uniref:GlxA family transcriptional regulator n=1 Tax=Pseudomonas sp. NPDC089547 TaxID=3390652 RepID=UPI003D094E89